MKKELKWILIWILAFTFGFICRDFSAQDIVTGSTTTYNTDVNGDTTGIHIAPDTTAWPITGSLELDTTTFKYISGPSLMILGDDTKRPLFDSVNHISIYHDSLTYELDIKPDRYFIHEQAWIFFMLDVDRRLKVIEQRLGILNKKE